MATFYFVRNAVTEMEAELNAKPGFSNNFMPPVLLGRSDQSSLCKLGRHEAENLGEWIDNRIVGQLALIASSPAPGAIETAEIALARTRFDGHPVVEFAELKAMDHGVHEGRLRKDVLSDPGVSEKRSRMGKDYAAERGESTNQVGARVLAWVESVRLRQEGVQDEQDKFQVLVFADRTCINSLAGYIRPHSTQFDVDHTQLNNASVSKLTYWGMVPSIQLNFSTQIQSPGTSRRVY